MARKTSSGKPKLSPSLLRRCLRSVQGWLVIIGLVLVAGFGNWFAHLPSAERAKWGGARPVLEEIGSWTVGITDNLGLTGRDAAIAYALPRNVKPTLPLPFGQPKRADPSKTPDDIQVLKRQGYWVGYSPTLRHAVWAAYYVPREKLLEEAPERPSFARDRSVKDSPAPDDYTRSGYDRGHMAPNYLIATRYGEAAQKETFLMTNIVPQRPTLNREPWRVLEHTVADTLSARSEAMWVITGTVQNPRRPTIGKRRVAVPDGFYKVVASLKKGKLRVLGFYMDQEAGERTRPRFTIRSVDELERLSGLDFFPDLPAEDQAALESVEATRYWPALDLF